MNPRPTNNLPPATALTARDVFYVLFRYKWLIGTISIVAVVATLALWLLIPVNYSSEAKLLVKYVVDTTPLTETGADARVTSMNTANTWESIMAAEQDMLTSLDVCDQVAKTIGAGKILPSAKITNDMAAAFAIQKQLLLDNKEKNSDVIHIAFSHPDRDMVVPILSQLISAYESMRAEVRRAKTPEKLTEVIDQAKQKVTESEHRLQALRNQTDVISLPDSERAIALDIDKTQGELDDVETDIKVEATIISEMGKTLPAGASSRPTNGAPGLTNQLENVPPAILAEYKRDNFLLNSLRVKETELLSWTTTNNLQVQSCEAQISNTEKKCQELEDQNPGLVAIKTVVAGSPESTTADPMVIYTREVMKAKALEVRYQMLTNQLALAKAKQISIVQAEGPLLDLQRESDGYRATLDYYQKRQGEADLDQILDLGNSQISMIEAPTPPVPVYSKTLKACAAVLFGGLALAFGLPFIIETYLDQSLKRPSDIRSRLGVPFFVSMPKLNGKFKRGLLNPEKSVPLLAANGGEVPAPESSQAIPGAPPAPSSNGNIAPWEQRHALRPFFETLRDRLMTYFEAINLTHKPKLVAVTSCGEGVGVTTTAAGLASALSETGDGNVLLVNMNVQDGEAHHFYRGKLTCGLEEALETDKRNASCVRENLFVAKDFSENENLPRVLPKRFSHLVPKMRASDYDYIIFDMPVMSQISITPRLARYMDMVLLVIESEKTDREVAKRATDMLLESKANVGVVLNKSRDRLPRRLQHDI